MIFIIAFIVCVFQLTLIYSQDVIAKEFFQSCCANGSGWQIKDKHQHIAANNGLYIYDCFRKYFSPQKYHIFGPFGNNSESIEKTFSTSIAHNRLLLSFKLFKFNEWSQEPIQVLINNQLLDYITFYSSNSQSNLLEAGNLCDPYINNQSEAIVHYMRAIYHNTSNITIKLLASTANQHVWGIREFSIVSNLCMETSCKFCQQQKCVMCWPGYELKGDSCLCPAGFYSQSFSSCTVGSQCAFCAPCYTQCLHCTGSSQNDCTVCANSEYLVAVDEWQPGGLKKKTTCVRHQRVVELSPELLFNNFTVSNLSYTASHMIASSGNASWFCGLNYILGGSQELANEGLDGSNMLFKNYSQLPAHSSVRLRALAMKLDYWPDNTEFWIRIDGTTKIFSRYYNTSIRPILSSEENLCADGDYLRDWDDIILVDVNFTHGGSFMVVEIGVSQWQGGSELPGQSGSSFWGIREIRVTLNRCDEACLDCINGGGSNECTTCASGYFASKVHQYPPVVNICFQCLKCHETCKECSGPSNNECLSCTAPLYYHTEERTCQSYCSPGQFIQITPKRVCLFCAAACLSCIDVSSQACLSCRTGYYLEGNECVLNCPSTKFKNNASNICQACDESCLSCRGIGPNNCLSCSNNAYFNNFTCIQSCPLLKKFTNNQTRSCDDCHSLCRSCSGPLQNNCLSCESLLFFSGDSQQCLSNCPNHKFGNQTDNICHNCVSPCSNCIGPGINDCLSCQVNLYLNSVQNSPVDQQQAQIITASNCVEQCPDGKYSNDSVMTCYLCKYPCQTCIHTADHCLTCSGQLRVDPPDCDCAKGFYNLSKSSECQECNHKCAACRISATQCTQCRGDRLNPPDCECPAGLKDTGDQNCQECLKECLTCEQNQLYCTSCKANREIQMDGQCLCPYQGVQSPVSVWCSTCSIAVITIDFSSDLSSLYIYFDYKVTLSSSEANTPSTANCKTLFQQQTYTKLGKTNPKCFIDKVQGQQKRININMGINAEITVNDTLFFSLSSGLRQDISNCSSQPITTFINNVVQKFQQESESGAGVANPIVLLSAPTQTKQTVCSDIEIVGSVIQGSGQRALQSILWSFSIFNTSVDDAKKPNTSQLETLVLLANEAQQLKLKIPSGTFDPSDNNYIFNVSYQNFLGFKGNTSVEIAISSSLKSPSIRIEELQLGKEITVYTWQKLKLNAAFNMLECYNLYNEIAPTSNNLPHQFKVEWEDATALNLGSNSTLPILFNKTTLYFNLTETKSQLNVPKYTCQPQSTYTIQAKLTVVNQIEQEGTASSNGISAENSSDSSEIQVSQASVRCLKSELVAFIQGGNRLISYKDIVNIVLIAKDPDVQASSNLTQTQNSNTSSFLIKWQCFNMITGGNCTYTENSQDIVIPENSLNQSFPARTFQAYNVYKFEATVERNGSIDNNNQESTKTSAYLIVTDQTLPDVTVTVSDIFLNQRNNPNQEIYIQVNVDQNKNISSTSSTTALQIYYFLIMQYNSEQVGQVSFNTNVFRFKIWNTFVNFTSTEKITFKFVAVSSKYAMPGSCTLDLKINLPPANGAITVSPLSGTSIDTNYTVTVENFTDTDLPLTYEYSIYYSVDALQKDLLLGTDQNRVVLSSFTTDSTFTFKCASGLYQNNSYTVVLLVRVSDSLGAITNVTKYFSVSPNTNTLQPSIGQRILKIKNSSQASLSTFNSFIESNIFNQNEIKIIQTTLSDFVQYAYETIQLDYDQNCDKNCSQHGACSKNKQSCTCYTGFYLRDCSATSIDLNTLIDLKKNLMISFFQNLVSTLNINSTGMDQFNLAMMPSFLQQNIQQVLSKLVSSEEIFQMQNITTLMDQISSNINLDDLLNQNFTNTNNCTEQDNDCEDSSGSSNGFTTVIEQTLIQSAMMIDNFMTVLHSQSAITETNNTKQQENQKKINQFNKILIEKTVDIGKIFLKSMSPNEKAREVTTNAFAMKAQKLTNDKFNEIYFDQGAKSLVQSQNQQSTSSASSTGIRRRRRRVIQESTQVFDITQIKFSKNPYKFENFPYPNSSYSIISSKMQVSGTSQSLKMSNQLKYLFKPENIEFELPNTNETASSLLRSLLGRITSTNTIYYENDVIIIKKTEDLNNFVCIERDTLNNNTWDRGTCLTYHYLTSNNELYIECRCSQVTETTIVYDYNGLFSVDRKEEEIQDMYVAWSKSLIMGIIFWICGIGFMTIFLGTILDVVNKRQIKHNRLAQYDQEHNKNKYVHTANSNEQENQQQQRQNQNKLADTFAANNGDDDGKKTYQELQDKQIDEHRQKRISQIKQNPQLIVISQDNIINAIKEDISLPEQNQISTVSKRPDDVLDQDKSRKGSNEKFNSNANNNSGGDNNNENQKEQQKGSNDIDQIMQMLEEPKLKNPEQKDELNLEQLEIELKLNEIGGNDEKQGEGEQIGSKIVQDEKKNNNSNDNQQSQPTINVEDEIEKMVETIQPGQQQQQQQPNDQSKSQEQVIDPILIFESIQHKLDSQDDKDKQQISGDTAQHIQQEKDTQSQETKSNDGDQSRKASLKNKVDQFKEHFQEQGPDNDNQKGKKKKKKKKKKNMTQSNQHNEEWNEIDTPQMEGGIGKKRNSKKNISTQEQALQSQQKTDQEQQQQQDQMQTQQQQLLTPHQQSKQEHKPTNLESFCSDNKLIQQSQQNSMKLITIPSNDTAKTLNSHNSKCETPKFTSKFHDEAKSIQQQQQHQNIVQTQAFSAYGQQKDQQKQNQNLKVKQKRPLYAISILAGIHIFMESHIPISNFCLFIPDFSRMLRFSLFYIKIIGTIALGGLFIKFTTIFTNFIIMNFELILVNYLFNLSRISMKMQGLASRLFGFFFLITLSFGIGYMLYAKVYPTIYKPYQDVWIYSSIYTIIADIFFWEILILSIKIRLAPFLYVNYDSDIMLIKVMNFLFHDPEIESKMIVACRWH